MIIMKSSEEANHPSITCCRLQVPGPACNYEVSSQGVRAKCEGCNESEAYAPTDFRRGSSNRIRRALTTGRYFIFILLS
jgi:hypothetical protein